MRVRQPRIMIAGIMKKKMIAFFYFFHIPSFSFSFFLGNLSSDRHQHHSPIHAHAQFLSNFHFFPKFMNNNSYIFYIQNQNYKFQVLPSRYG